MIHVGVVTFKLPDAWQVIEHGPDIWYQKSHMKVVTVVSGYLDGFVTGNLLYVTCPCGMVRDSHIATEKRNWQFMQNISKMWLCWWQNSFTKDIAGFHLESLHKKQLDNCQSWVGIVIFAFPQSLISWLVVKISIKYKDAVCGSNKFEDTVLLMIRIFLQICFVNCFT